MRSKRDRVCCRQGSNAVGDDCRNKRGPDAAKRNLGWSQERSRMSLTLMRAMLALPGTLVRGNRTRVRAAPLFRLTFVAMTCGWVGQAMEITRLVPLL